MLFLVSVSWNVCSSLITSPPSPSSHPATVQTFWDAVWARSAGPALPEIAKLFMNTNASASGLHPCEFSRLPGSVAHVYPALYADIWLLGSSVVDNIWLGFLEPAMQCSDDALSPSIYGGHQKNASCLELWDSIAGAQTRQQQALEIKAQPWEGNKNRK